MITAMSREAFIADAWQVAGRKVSKERFLSDVYATAAGSVGLPVHPDSDAVRMFRLVLTEGRSLIRQRDEIEARAVELLSDLPDYQLLTTIPGIGPINAMTILAEAGDLCRFRHHRQFLKFCGMDLATVQSGMFRGQSGISKYGKCPVAPDALDGRPNGSAEADQQLFGTSLNDTSQRIGITPICVARPTPPSRPRLRAPYTPWSNTANPIAPSSRG